MPGLTMSIAEQDSFAPAAELALRLVYEVPKKPLFLPESAAILQLVDETGEVIAVHTDQLQGNGEIDLSYTLGAAGAYKIAAEIILVDKPGTRLETRRTAYRTAFLTIVVAEGGASGDLTESLIAVTIPDPSIIDKVASLVNQWLVGLVAAATIVIGLLVHGSALDAAVFMAAGVMILAVIITRMLVRRHTSMRDGHDTLVAMVAVLGLAVVKDTPYTIVGKTMDRARKVVHTELW